MGTSFVAARWARIRLAIWVRAHIWAAGVWRALVGNKQTWSRCIVWPLAARRVCARCERRLRAVEREIIFEKRKQNKTKKSSATSFST